ncbi:MAG TPA: FG-GAP-like repeat-containing protein, partial [Rhizomicrobium sp.]|nr:FG-GAP-like repeat-containing protein [Rhizomicrobium sp.]
MPACAIAAAPPPMTTPGQFSVSATGAATYSIPIIVPPGTAGLAPSLSLNYSSQSGNGILGVGWSLGGLPAMTRCPQSYAQDNAHVGVNYNVGDRFCLNGQRLLFVSTTGNYGDNGTEYRTEIESYSRIILHTQTGVTGPAWFEVHTKSGQIIELGNSTDSRILASGTSVARVWAASKISDTVGNYMQVFYTTDQGQYYPDHILYTGNGAVVPYNSVFFIYQSRSDASTLYHAGSMISTAKLLSDIKTYMNTTGAGTPVTDYKLGYTLGNAPFSQLTSVQRCDGTGTTAGCLAPTTLGWQTASTWSSRIVIDSMPTLPSGFTGATYLSADLNGDGVPDGYVENGNCGAASGLAQPLFGVAASGFVASNMTYTPYGGSPIPACILAQPQSIGQTGPSPFVDFNGDGFTDVTGLIGVWMNDTAGNFNGPQHWLVMPPANATNGLSLYGDFDGDGRADWFNGINMNGTTTYLNLGNGDGTFRQGTGYSFGTSSNFASGTVIGDIDGDGCADLIIQGNSNLVVPTCPSPVSSIPVANYTNLSKIYLGDFNGDGLGDFITFPSNGSNATLNISTGTSFIQTAVSGLTCGGCNAMFANGIFIGDFDGDGKTDVAMVIPHYLKIYTWQSGTLALALSVNIDLPQVGCLTGCTPPSFNGILQSGDVDGDGCTDLIVDQTYYIKFGCHPPLLMTSISNGVGASTTIGYGKLNDNQPFYTKCPLAPTSYACGDSYPTQAVDGPIYVVKEVDTSNGIGGTFATTYTYAGAKNDLSGRGFLGYQQVTATDHQTGVVETTSYNMLFPLTGTVLEKKRTLSSVVLSDTINAYLSVPAVPVVGTPTFVYLSMSTVSGHEVDGTALPSTTTANTNPDAYGNIQTINVTVSDGSSKATQNTYSNDATNWFLGQLTQTVVTSIVGTSTITRTSSFHYNAANGVLDKEIIEPTATGCNGNSTACLLETDYTLDAYGHRHIAVVSGAGFASRTTTVTYGANGTFATATQNNLGQADATDYSGPNGAAFGGPTSHTDLNTLQTVWSIDTLGRETLETRPGTQGTKTAVSYQYCNLVNGGTASCPTYGAYLVQATPYAHDGITQDGPATKTYYDAL